MSARAYGAWVRSGLGFAAGNALSSRVRALHTRADARASFDALRTFTEPITLTKQSCTQHCATLARYGIQLEWHHLVALGRGLKARAFPPPV